MEIVFAMKIVVLIIIEVLVTVGEGVVLEVVFVMMEIQATNLSRFY